MVFIKYNVHKSLTRVVTNHLHTPTYILFGVVFMTGRIYYFVTDLYNINY